MITVKYVKKSLEDQIAAIKAFLVGPNDMANYLVDYFKLTNYFDKTEAERDVLLKQKIGDLYHNNQDILAEKVATCQKQWAKNEGYINAQFEKIFGEKFDFDCVAQVNFNPICPRFIESKEFDVNALDNDAGILETSLHEIIHFAWFNVWNQQFPNTTHAEMNAPSRDWLISEIVVDPIFKQSGLKSFLVREPAYDYLYQEKINNKNLMEVVNDLYVQSSSIKDFQNRMLDMVKHQESEKNVGELSI